MLTEPDEFDSFSDETFTVEVPGTESAPVQDHGPPYPEPEPDFAT
jgi:hypothetical protein